MKYPHDCPIFDFVHQVSHTIPETEDCLIKVCCQKKLLSAQLSIMVIINMWAQSFLSSYKLSHCLQRRFHEKIMSNYVQLKISGQSKWRVQPQRWKQGTKLGSMANEPWAHISTYNKRAIITLVSTVRWALTPWARPLKRLFCSSCFSLNMTIFWHFWAFQAWSFPSYAAALSPGAFREALSWQSRLTSHECALNPPSSVSQSRRRGNSGIHGGNKP